MAVYIRSVNRMIYAEPRKLGLAPKMGPGPPVSVFLGSVCYFIVIP